MSSHDPRGRLPPQLANKLLLKSALTWPARSHYPCPASVIMENGRGGMAEQIPRPGQSGPPPRHRADRRPLTSRQPSPSARASAKEDTSTKPPGVRAATPKHGTAWPAEGCRLAPATRPPTRGSAPPPSPRRAPVTTSHDQ